MPEYAAFLDLADAHPELRLDVTMALVDFWERPADADVVPRLEALGDRVLFGTDFPNIPYAYAEQVSAVARWAESDARLGANFLRSVLHDAPARLLAF